MRRTLKYKNRNTGDVLALGLTEDGEVGVAIKNGDQAKAFLFSSEEQIDVFIHDLTELKYEMEEEQYPLKKVRIGLSPVEKLIEERLIEEYQEEEKEDEEEEYDEENYVQLHGRQGKNNRVAPRSLPLRRKKLY